MSMHCGKGAFSLVMENRVRNEKPNQHEFDIRYVYIFRSVSAQKRGDTRGSRGKRVWYIRYIRKSILIFRHNEIFDTISQHYNYPLEEASIRYIESSMLIFRYDNPTLTVTSSKKAPWITPRDTLPFLVRSYLKKNKKKSICCRCCCCCCCQRRRLTALLLLDGQPSYHTKTSALGQRRLSHAGHYHDLDHLDHPHPHLPFWGDVHDLYGTDLTQESSPRSCRLYGFPPATWARSYRSYRSFRSGIYLPCLSDLHHTAGIDDLSDVRRLSGVKGRRSTHVFDCCCCCCSCSFGCSWHWLPWLVSATPKPAPTIL